MANKLQYTYRSSATLSDETIEFIRTRVEEAGSFPRFVDKLVAAEMAGEHVEVDPALLTTVPSAPASSSSPDKAVLEQMESDKGEILQAIRALAASKISESVDNGLLGTPSAGTEAIDVEEFREGIVSDMKRVLDGNSRSAYGAPSSSSEPDLDSMKEEISQSIDAAFASLKEEMPELLASDADEEGYFHARAESDVRELIAVQKEELAELAEVKASLAEVKGDLKKLLSAEREATSEEIETLLAKLESGAEVPTAGAEDIAAAKRDAWSTKMESLAEDELEELEELAALNDVSAEERLPEDAGDATPIDEDDGDVAGVTAEPYDTSSFPTDDDEFSAGLADLLSDADDDDAEQEIARQVSFEQELRDAWKASTPTRRVSVPEAPVAADAKKVADAELDEDMMVGASVLLLDE